ncbi:hypothetical protein QQF64_016001 [Cirrhinus molitorella]
MRLLSRGSVLSVCLSVGQKSWVSLALHALHSLLLQCRVASGARLTRFSLYRLTHSAHSSLPTLQLSHSPPPCLSVSLPPSLSVSLSLSLSRSFYCLSRAAAVPCFSTLSPSISPSAGGITSSDKESSGEQRREVKECALRDK